MELTGIDHVVLTVADLDRTCAFYERVLDARIERVADTFREVHVGGAKFNLHEAGSEFAPHAADPTPGAVDVCLTTATPTEQVADELAARGVDLVVGPVERQGARGEMTSVYLRDPDGNLVEVATY